MTHRLSKGLVVVGSRRHRFAERRKALGLSQERLAEAVGVDTSTVARWERGATEPQAVHRPRLAKVLSVPPEEVSDLLNDADVMPVIPQWPRCSDASTSSIPGAGAPRSPISEVYASALRSFRAADRQVGGGHLYGTVVSYLHQAVAPSMFRAPSGGGGRYVFTAAAALTEMAGWMAHDAGRDNAAQEHFARSYDLACTGTDRQLAAHVLASMSHLALHLAQPQEAIGLARRAKAGLSGGPRQPELEALLLGLEARGKAALGEGRVTAELLCQAESALATSPDEPPSQWVNRFDEAALANEAARSLYQLGDLRAARGEAERIIELRPPERARSRALGQLILVAVLLAQGRLEEACGVALEVLAATEHLGSCLVFRQLSGVRQRVLPHRRNAAASALLPSLDEALLERGWLYVGGGHHESAATLSLP